VSNLSNQLRQGTLPALYRATNTMILGDGLAEKIGALGLGERDLDDTLYGKFYLKLRSKNVPSIAAC